MPRKFRRDDGIDFSLGLSPAGDPADAEALNLGSVDEPVDSEFVDSGGVPAAATPNCPDMAGLDDEHPNAECTALKIHGNVFNDKNRNGRYDPNTGLDTRWKGVHVRLINGDTSQVVGQSITNKDGYYRFPLLPIGPRYIVQAIPPDNCESTTVQSHEFELRDFSTFWCCSARGDFGFYDRGFTPGHPQPPGPPSGQPPAPPCCQKPTGQQTHLPILNYQANDNVCSTIIEVQNLGGWDSKAMLLLWGAPGACPPQCAGPLKVECSGLLRPGSTWNFIGAQLPSRAKSGMVFSAPAISTPGVGDVFRRLAL